MTEEEVWAASTIDSPRPFDVFEASCVEKAARALAGLDPYSTSERWKEIADPYRAAARIAMIHLMDLAWRTAHDTSSPRKGDHA